MTERLRSWAIRARRPLLRGVAGLCAVVLSSILVLLVSALREPLPEALLRDDSPSSLRIHDRHGRLLRELRGRDGRKGASVALDQLSPYLVPALLAAEDARFFWHFGVDPIAIARAALQAVGAGRFVSGGSTVTQQLARALVPRPRTLAGKLREAAIATRIEMELDKERILEEYLSRIEFAPNIAGIEAASRHYFDKPARALDLAESATLVGFARGPTHYDPRRGTTRIAARRRYVLERLRAEGALEDAVIDRAERAEPVFRYAAASQGTEHFSFALASGKLVPEVTSGAARSVTSTLDGELQRDVEGIARLASAELARVGASAVSLLVVGNDTAEVRAYVGSPDYFAAAALGSNDGARALRQPGSALKPFVYAAAIEKLGWTPATLIPDLRLVLSTPTGPHVPENYDGLEHGPVRLRVALANSLNLPALHAAMRVGPSRVVELLRRFGFDSLKRDPEHYGAAIALGDGEVRLSELAAAYSALARDGEWRPLRYATAIELQGGVHRQLVSGEPRAVIAPTIARQITSMLADDVARRPSFGVDSVLAFPFPVAAKTGTSKAFRDNWAVGYTREVTVAVWVGNFDGRPMVGSSGISGAGPIFRAVLERAMRGVSPRPLLETAGLVEREICPLSGALLSEACPHRVREHFMPERVPTARCEFHERAWIDPATGARVAASCPGAEARTFERYPDAYRAWAERAGRPLAPPLTSARCSRVH